MTPKTLMFLAGLTIVTVSAATIAVVDNADQFTTKATGEPMFPQLVDRANDVAKITVKTDKETVTVEKGDAGWIMKAKDGYPVNVGTISRIVAELARLRLVEKMTDRPENFSKLEVEDVDKKNANSKLLTLQDAKGETLASLIVGKLELITSHANEPGLYVRRPGDNQTWRAQGELVLPNSPEQWLASRIVDIKKEKVKRIAFKDEGEKGEAFSLVREAADKPFALEPKPEKGTLKEDKAKDVADMMTDIELRDVRKEGKVPFTTTVRHVTLENTDGLVVKAEVVKLMDKYWARFKAEAGEGAKEDVAKRVKEINERVAGWVYEVVDYKGDKMLTKRQDLIEEKDKKAGS